jgi:Holliday junction resolvase
MTDPAKKSASRRKGAAEERALVRYLQARGFAAEKSSRTGYAGHDLTVPVLGRDRRVEVKVRGNGFRRLYEWLDGADLLIVRADRREPLVVLPMRLAAEIAAAAEGRKTTGEGRKVCEGRLPFMAHPPIGEG